MNPIRRRDVLAATAVAMIASAIVASPPFDRLRGLGIDVLTWLRWTTLGARHEPNVSPTVVVALDEETYNSPPFNRTPTVTWTREIAKVLTATIDAGAVVVGFDIIFPNSIEQSEIAFGDETVGAKLRGFDRDFLRALAAAARAGKLVLGQVQHREYPIRPSEGQRIAVGHQANIRALNFHSDPDDIVRRMPISFNVDGEAVPSMAVELASRALRSEPRRGQDGRLVLGERRIALSTANTFTINFAGGADDIPTYSLADLRACADAGNADFFRTHFAGRIVLMGAVLDIEDRKVASKRFATGVEGARADRCALPRPATTSKFVRDSVAGVYIHATAVNNLIRGEALTELGRGQTWLGMALLTWLVAGVALLWSPAIATVALVVILTVWSAGAVAAFASGFVLPLIDAAASCLIGLFATVGYRFGVADRDKHLLRKSFALYLPPALIERMLATSKPPALGGEARDVTVYFSDLASFSTLAEGMKPTELVALMNVYLSAMTDIIEAHGGFVDKYIGDAIVAIFGAPVEDCNHARNAVRAALACQGRLDEMNGSNLLGLKCAGLAQRIGINSGAALVGNVGSSRRFNYTAMGDTVNLAARLEGANKHYGTTIIVSAETAALAGDAITWRELDTVRVVGISRPSAIFEPLALAGERAAVDEATTVAYAEGLRCWRARDFEGASEAFARVADRDRPSQLILARARALCRHAPPADWQPVNYLDTK